jgi:uncharacterized membrane protein
MEETVSLKQIKYFGGIGHILILLGWLLIPLLTFLPEFFPSLWSLYSWFFVAIPALPCILGGTGLSALAFKKLAGVTLRKEIFRDYLFSLLFWGIGIIIFPACFFLPPFVLISMVVGFIILIIIGIIGSLISLSDLPGSQSGLFYPWFLGSLVTGILFSFSFFLASGKFLRKCFQQIAQETGIKLFETTGKIYFLGASLTIILLGFLIEFISLVLTSFAFFSLPDSLSGKKISSLA